MGRFPWNAGHSKQGSDKGQLLPHEWFNKSTIEPSRKALEQWRRELETSGDTSPTSTRARSRSNTVTSTLSFYAKSSSDKSSDSHTRPPSRQSTVHEAGQDSGRQEHVARTLFNKGSRMIKRRGSKFNLLPSQMPSHAEHGQTTTTFIETDESTIPKQGSSRGSSYRFNLSGSPKGADIKANISVPYAFQHLTHTDQSQFQSLNKVTKSDLVSEFAAVQDGQSPAHEIQGIPVGDLPPSTETLPGSVTSPPLSPTVSAMPDPPSTPPRPSPPPKDSTPAPKTPDVRLSRSMENFSRPTRSPVASAFLISSVAEHTAETSSDSHVSSSTEVPPPSGWAQETANKLAHVTTSCRDSHVPTQALEKPLPQPPNVVHAVSTNDESALPLPSAPLPQLPQVSAPVGKTITPAAVEGSQSQIPHRVSLRHAQSFPTTRLLRRRSQSSSDIPFASSFAEGTSTVSPNKPKTISIGIEKIDIEDWEDAIDYAWDHPLDMEGEPITPLEDQLRSLDQPQSRPESYLVIRQPPSESATSPSTPLMMQSPSPAPDRALPTLIAQRHSLALHGQSSKTSLRGLGIASGIPKTQAAAHTSQFDRSSKPEFYSMPLTHSGLRREPGSSISKSSSQESIILSIASSIMGTQRSSNSSTSLGDMSTLASIEDEGEDGYVEIKAHRSIDCNTPFGSAAARSCDDASGSGNTSDGSQETVKTDVVPTAPSYPPPPPPEETGAPSSPKHRRGTSISRADVPKRTSSTGAPAMAKGQATRARSHTLTARPRYNASRASYSLFPTTQPTLSRPAPITPTP